MLCYLFLASRFSLYVRVLLALPPPRGRRRSPHAFSLRMVVVDLLCSCHCLLLVLLCVLVYLPLPTSPPPHRCLSPPTLLPRAFSLSVRALARLFSWVCAPPRTLPAQNIHDGRIRGTPASVQRALVLEPPVRGDSRGFGDGADEGHLPVH